MLKPTNIYYLPDTVTIFNPSVDGKTFYPCVIKHVNFNERKTHNFRITGILSDTGFNIVYDIKNSKPSKPYVKDEDYKRLNDNDRKVHFTLTGNMFVIKGSFEQSEISVTELTVSKMPGLLKTKFSDTTELNGIGNIQFGG